MTDDVAEIPRLEDERYKAVIGEDLDALEPLLHDDLVYIHSNGVADTKATFMSGISDVVWDYRDVARADQTIKARGNTAFEFNQSTIDIIVRGTSKLVRTRTPSVWPRRRDRGA